MLAWHSPLHQWSEAMIDLLGALQIYLIGRLLSESRWAGGQCKHLCNHYIHTTHGTSPLESTSHCLLLSTSHRIPCFGIGHGSQTIHETTSHSLIPARSWQLLYFLISQNGFKQFMHLLFSPPWLPCAFPWQVLGSEKMNIGIVKVNSCSADKPCCEALSFWRRSCPLTTHSASLIALSASCHRKLLEILQAMLAIWIWTLALNSTVKGFAGKIL